MLRHIFLIFFFSFFSLANIPPFPINTDGTSSTETKNILLLNAVTLANGAIRTYTYDSIGNITLIETPTQTISKTYTAYGTSKNDFLYTGEQLDSETEDYFLRARYYSPDSGRFVDDAGNGFSKLGGIIPPCGICQNTGLCP